jgi:hypothetical protein
MDIDKIAEEFVSGERSCSDCAVLNDLVMQVRTGQINMEEFKKILRENANSTLSKTL